MCPVLLPASVAPTPRSQSARLMMSVRMCQGMMLLHGVAAPIWSNCSSNGLRYWDSYDFDFCNRWVCGFSEWYFLVIRGQLASTNIQNLCNHRDFNVFLCWFYDTKPLSFLKMFFIFLKFLFLFTFRIFQERCHPQTPPCRQEDPLQTWRDVFCRPLYSVYTGCSYMSFLQTTGGSDRVHSIPVAVGNNM